MEFKQGDLVTVRLDNNGVVHEVHGAFMSMVRQAVVVEDGISYTCLPSEAAAWGVEAEDWVSIQAAHGGRMPAPAGSRSAWGGVVSGSSFPLNSPDWLLSSFHLKVRSAASSVTIVPITEAGKSWIEANLTAEVRYGRLRRRIEAAMPAEESSAVLGELEDLIYLFKADAVAEERAAQYEY